MFSRCCCSQGLTDVAAARNSYPADPNHEKLLAMPIVALAFKGEFALLAVMPLIELLFSLAPIRAASSTRNGSAAVVLMPEVMLFLLAFGVLTCDGTWLSIEKPNTIGGNCATPVPSQLLMLLP